MIRALRHSSPSMRRPGLAGARRGVACRGLALLSLCLSLGLSLWLAACSSPSASPGPARVDEASLRDARFVLLGEVHDNPEQHRLRAELLGRLLADGRPTSVVFEQMDRGHDAAIDAADRNAEAVVDAGHLDRKGWGWPLHRPLIEAALRGKASVRGGDLGNEDARAIVRRGAAAVPADLAPLLGEVDWSTADESRVEADIDRGHCGALPPKLLPAMALAQRARDAALAQAMLQAGRDHERVVLIAGNGHVRRDLGVPRYLLVGGAPAAAIVTVGYLEAADRQAPYDQVQVTPSIDRPDPCLDFRAPRP